MLVPIEVSAQTTVRIAFNGFGGVAPLYLGQETGIFKKQGLNLELVFIPGGSLSLQALIGKSLDLLMTGGPPVVNASLQGAKIKIIAGVINLLPYTFVVTSGIRSAELVKGKKIGISRFGSNTDYVVRLALNHFSLMPNDVQIIQVGGSQARLVALQSGAIQATVLSPEEALVAQKLGFGVLLDFIEKEHRVSPCELCRARGLFGKSRANGENFHESLRGNSSALQNSPSASCEENHGA